MTLSSLTAFQPYFRPSRQNNRTGFLTAMASSAMHAIQSKYYHILFQAFMLIKGRPRRVNAGMEGMTIDD